MVKKPPANAGDMGLIPGLGDPTCCRAAKPLCATTIEPKCLEPVLCNKRRHCNEKPSNHSDDEHIIHSEIPF